MNVAELRQTDLSLQDLIKDLENPQSGCPRCLIINEISVACLGGEDSDGKGEEVLLSLLDSKVPRDRLLAFSWISSIPDMAERNSFVLEKFRNKTENQSHLDEMDKQIALFKQRVS